MYNLDMHCQQLRNHCGPCSIQNALEILGVRICQLRLAELCGTDSSGTDEEGMVQGLDSLGIQYSILETRCKHAAYSWLLHSESPSILCVDNWDHWLTVKPYYLGTLMEYDPALEHRRPVAMAAILKRWEAAAENEGATFYGFRIHSV